MDACVCVLLIFFCFFGSPRSLRVLLRYSMCVCVFFCFVLRVHVCVWVFIYIYICVCVLSSAFDLVCFGCVLCGVLGFGVLTRLVCVHLSFWEQPSSSLPLEEGFLRQRDSLKDSKGYKVVLVGDASCGKTSIATRATVCDRVDTIVECGSGLCCWCP